MPPSNATIEKPPVNEGLQPSGKHVGTTRIDVEPPPPSEKEKAAPPATNPTPPPPKEKAPPVPSKAPETSQPPTPAPSEETETQSSAPAPSEAPETQPPTPSEAPKTQPPVGETEKPSEEKQDVITEAPAPPPPPIRPDGELMITSEDAQLTQFPLLNEIRRLIASVEIKYQPGVLPDGMEANRFYVSAKHPAIGHLEMSDQLAYVLGFRNRTQVIDGEVAEYDSDLHGGFNSFGVYGRGLAEEVIVGNSLSSLLRIIAVDGIHKHGTLIEKVYESPMYVKVLQREITEIEIELRTLSGKYIPFQFGTVIVTLVFKKIINL